MPSSLLIYQPNLFQKCQIWTFQLQTGNIKQRLSKYQNFYLRLFSIKAMIYCRLDCICHQILVRAKDIHLWSMFMVDQTLNKSMIVSSLIGVHTLPQVKVSSMVLLMGVVPDSKEMTCFMRFTTTSDRCLSVERDPQKSLGKNSIILNSMLHLDLGIQIGQRLQFLYFCQNAIVKNVFFSSAHTLFPTYFAFILT